LNELSFFERNLSEDFDEEVVHGVINLKRKKNDILLGIEETDEEEGEREEVVVEEQECNSIPGTKKVKRS